MASTEKVSVSLDRGSLLLARRAAQLEGLSLSAYLSKLIRRRAWESERPAMPADDQARIDAHTVELDEQEERSWRGGEGHHAAG
ncbi:MAG: hypothetical protein L0H84_03340 [Pseudonocardia sp.]|nr:hypothetical protein [Pseudonocardia sp.]